MRSIFGIHEPRTSFHDDMLGVQVAKIMEQAIVMPLLNDDEMRRTAAVVLPSLLRCAQLAASKQTTPEANETTVRELFDLLMKGLVKVCPCPCVLYPCVWFTLVSTRFQPGFHVPLVWGFLNALSRCACRCTRVFGPPPFTMMFHPGFCVLCVCLGVNA